MHAPRLRSDRVQRLRPAGRPRSSPTVGSGSLWKAGGGTEREAEFAHSRLLGLGGLGGERKGVGRASGQ